MGGKERANYGRHRTDKNCRNELGIFTLGTANRTMLKLRERTHRISGVARYGGRLLI